MKDTWKEISGKKYYLGSDGAAATGPFELDGDTYYFGSDGVLKTSTWVKIDGEKYYVNGKGIVQKDLCDEIEVIAPVITKWTRNSSTSMTLN